MTSWEPEVAKQLGVSRAVLQRLRATRLAPGVDFRREKKRCIYTDCGVDKIRGLLNLPEIKSASGANGAPASSLPEPVTLLVWNPRLVNTRILLAYAPNTDPQRPENLVRVRVHSTANFVRFVNGKPMELRARHISGDLYELAGRCPRFKGRW